MRASFNSRLKLKKKKLLFDSLRFAKEATTTKTKENYDHLKKKFVSFFCFLDVVTARVSVWFLRFTK